MNDAELPHNPDHLTAADVGQASVSCNPTIEQLYDFMGGNLSDLKMSEFQTHMRLCAGCDDVFHFHQGLLNMVSSSCREEMPAELRQRLLNSITKLF